MIDNRKLEYDNPMIILNQNLGIYQNPFPQHQANNVSLHPHENQVTHNWSYDNSTFIGMINITTRSQKVQGK